MPPQNDRFASNQEPRCPLVLLLDVSGSMSGNPIDELNKGLVEFKNATIQDPLASLRVEVAIITFGPVTTYQDFTTVVNFTPPTLTTQGLTPMGEAIECGLDMIENRKEDLRNNGIQYYRPWLFLITDGGPTDAWQNAAQRVRQSVNEKKLSFFAVGVQNADMSVLSQITVPEFAPVKLNGLDFKSMFVWLSASMQQVSHSTPGATTMIQVAQPTWGQIAT